MQTWEDEGGAIPEDEWEELEEELPEDLIENWDEIEDIDDYKYVERDN